MIRVIGGTHKGRLLRSLPGDSTRPPLARVRGAMANILSGHIQGASVLDAFSGTGSYSIELLSRGAISSLCIDKNPKAVKVIKENLRALDLLKSAQVIEGDALRVLPSLEREGISFHIILVAPPYFTGLDEKAMVFLGQSKLLKPQGILVLQQHRKEKHKDNWGNLEIIRSYSYGETRLKTYRLLSPRT